MDRALNLKQKPVLRVILLDAEVDIVGEGLQNALLERCLHDMLKVVARLHAAAEQSRAVVLDKVVVHGRDEAPDLAEHLLVRLLAGRTHVDDEFTDLVTKLLCGVCSQPVVM